MKGLGFWPTMRGLGGGESLLRIYMNHGFASHTLLGRTIDVGGGRNPNYFDYFQKGPSLTIEAIDGTISGIDFERDPLPFEDESVDMVICANVLEHVYNHRFFVEHMARVLRRGGTLVGFVPFFIQYHPDPHDYFRYTKEALQRIFEDAGFRKIRITEVGDGPFALNYNTIMLSMPLVCRLALYPLYFLADGLFLRLRPRARERYPLGYIFSVAK